MSTDPCVISTLEGSACASQCKLSAREPDNDDACCPKGANANTDHDCEPRCGNGEVESGETCDPPGSCPKQCKSDDPCSPNLLTGAADSCNVRCEPRAIEACGAADGCCPAQCTHPQDSDCSVSCGDGVVEPSAGETCEPGTMQPCATDCADADPCTQDVMTGSPASCNVVCSHTLIVTPQNGDGCCPPDGNRNVDMDCPARCGNGVVEEDERCDGNCPQTAADCDDGIACTADAVAGTACDRHCTHSTIVAASRMKDGCCPPGANANEDVDCPPVCGNNVVEPPDELCDGNCPVNAASCDDGIACTRDEVMGLACRRQCRSVTITSPSQMTDACCPPGGNANNDADCVPQCGNGEIEGDETCDDGNVQAGDGCNASCQPDDNTSTPGDDRAGFITCAGMTCTPGSICCGDNPQACVISGGACNLVAASCDGPEDCPAAGEVCVQLRLGRVCAQGGGAIVCHTDADCATATCGGEPCRICRGGSCGS